MIVLDGLIVVLLLGVAGKAFVARFWLGGVVGLALAAGHVIAIVVAARGVYGTSPVMPRIASSYLLASIGLPPLIWLVGKTLSSRATEEPRRAKLKESAELFLLPWGLALLAGAIVLVRHLR